MKSIAVSAKQYCSHQFLVELTQQGQYFTWDNNLISQNSDQLHSTVEDNFFDNSQHYLFIYAENLTLDVVCAISRELSSEFAFSAISMVSLGDLDKQASVCLSVKKLTESSVSPLLDSLAHQYYVELNLLANIPTLKSPGLLLMDMDSTVIDMECIDEIAKLANVGEEVSQVTELAMQGKIDFTASLQQRVSCLKGIKEPLLQSIRDRLPLMPGITRLLSTLKYKGWTLAIASGGFTFFADHLKTRLDLDYAVSNVLEVNNSQLTGRVLGEVVDAQVKADTLLRLAHEKQLPVAQTIALGDGANDLVMMDAAGLGVAYHAKPLVLEQADCCTRFYGHEVLLHILSHG